MGRVFKKNRPLSEGKENIRSNKQITFYRVEFSILLLFGNGPDGNFGKAYNLLIIRFYSTPWVKIRWRK